MKGKRKDKTTVKSNNDQTKQINEKGTSDQVWSEERKKKEKYEQNWKTI